MPPKSQAHCLVARADTKPKPAKELALPPHGLTGIKHETLINRTLSGLQDPAMSTCWTTSRPNFARI